MIYCSSTCCANAFQPAGRGLRLVPSVWLAVAIVIGVAPNSYASNGDNAIVPQDRMGVPTYSKQSGLQIRVDSTWAGSRGYRPVTITVSTAKPATADTQLTVIYQAGGWRFQRRAIKVEADFELKQGTTTASTTFSVPQYSDWNSYGWETWVDGIKDEQLCMAGSGYNSGAGGANAAGIFTSGTEGPLAAQLLSAATNGSIETHLLGLANLPDRWVDYSPLDVMVTTVDALQLLQVSSSDKLKELLRWVHAGGNLWVIEIGQDFSELPRLEQLLDSTRKDGAQVDELEVVPLDRWHFLTFDTSGQFRLNDLVEMSLGETEKDTTLSTLEIFSSSNPNLAADSRRWFVARSWGFGTIVAFQNRGTRRRQILGGTAEALQRSSLKANMHWATRHGNDPALGNPDFNNWLIPDVGTAPVFEFQMLISLFVIGIGPVNYWLLKRRNQLPLLLITVPVAAAAATAMLFTYGVLADGIGARVRARSVTLLDQRAGEASSWARLSYYAGIAPSDGLEMPNDTTVYPILPARSEYNSFGQRGSYQQRSLQWEESQKLTRGWLGSRTPTQYLAQTSRPTKNAIHFEATENQLNATNHLGSQVLALVVQDQQGKIYVADQLAEDASIALTASSHTDALSKLRLLITENLPQLPDGYVGGGNYGSNRRSRRNYNNVPLSDSLMELQLEAIMSPLAKDWGNGTYIAVTAEGIELSLGLEDATESNSFHVVRGTW